MSATVLTPAARHFELGLKASAEAEHLMRGAVVRLVESGRHFRQAQTSAAHGEFLALIDASKVSRTQVYRAIEFVTAFEDWLREEHPTLHGARLDAAVDKAVMQSPKPLSSWLRAIGLVKEVGAYDPAAYQQKKLAGGQQLTFAYEFFESQVRALVETETVRDLSRSSLLKLKGELEEAQAKVEEALAGKGEEVPV